ncbi:hypothetical protein SBA4_3030014 [Candidatus Sulfopaludibacter sp. SbA4]|nr:hypothetical protein SBA4_3030014 [Candidatus Sulfopaludibacter sp. SbA4]
MGIPHAAEHESSRANHRADPFQIRLLEHLTFLLFELIGLGLKSVVWEPAYLRHLRLAELPKGNLY